jgi:hypothetical protein
MPKPLDSRPNFQRTWSPESVTVVPPPVNATSSAEPDSRRSVTVTLSRLARPTSSATVARGTLTLQEAYGLFGASSDHASSTETM